MLISRTHISGSLANRPAIQSKGKRPDAEYSMDNEDGPDDQTLCNSQLSHLYLV
jgi:hypothetical protein